MPSPITYAKLSLLVLQERAARRDRPREPEPMVMNDEESVDAFHVAHPVLQLPVYQLNALALSRLLPQGGRLLDLGSGTGRLLAHLAQARPDLRITGTDLADNMLAVGRRWLAEAGLDDRVDLRKADMTAIPDELTRDVDAISCIWALHHLPTEEHARACLREIARVRAATGCAVWIFDFARCRNARLMPALIATAPDAPQRLRADGVASERAAWTDRELRGWLQEAGLGDLLGGRERAVGWCQAYFAPARHPRPAGEWRGAPLPAPGERDAKRLRAGLPAFPAG